jgi:inner membrane protein involved in colicin E2 resistance
MFALAALVVFLIGAVRDFFATAPTHQTGVLFIGLALLALHLVWAVALPRLHAAP